FSGGAYTGNVTISNACTSTLTATGVSNPSVTGTSNSITVVQVSSFDAFETTTAANAITGVIQTRVAGNTMPIAIVAIFSGAQAASFNSDVKLELLANGTP